VLRSLVVEQDDYPLKAPFRISRGIKTRATVITVHLIQDGHTGRGEGVPYPRYRETFDTARREIEGVRDLIEGEADHSTILAAMPEGAARNAVDCALWDLAAALTGKSVASMLGLPQPLRTASAITIGIEEPDAMADVARANAHVPLLKVKLDADRIEERLRAVRTAAPLPRLIVDPNESWGFADLTAIEPLLVGHRVDLIEQPLPAEADGALGSFTSRIPICADEAAHVAGDLDGLVGRYQVVNIKLDKTGGLTGAVEMADRARALGFGVMVGCMVSSSLSIAPALLLAARADFVDLDGPLWLRADHADGVLDTDGWLCPPSDGFWGTTLGAGFDRT